MVAASPQAPRIPTWSPAWTGILVERISEQHAEYAALLRLTLAEAEG